MKSIFSSAKSMRLVLIFNIVCIVSQLALSAILFAKNLNSEKPVDLAFAIVDLSLVFCLAVFALTFVALSFRAKAKMWAGFMFASILLDLAFFLYDFLSVILNFNVFYILLCLVFLVLSICLTCLCLRQKSNTN